MGMPWRVLIFSIVLFAFSILIYFGIRFGYSSYLDSREETLDKDIEQLSNQVSAEDQNELVKFYSQLTNLKKALDRHSYGSNIFSFLEKNTIGSVYWENAVYNDSGTVVLRGHAASLDNVVEQLTVFERRPELVKTEVQNISLEKGVSFNALLSFKGSYYEQPVP